MTNQTAINALLLWAKRRNQEYGLDIPEKFFELLRKLCVKSELMWAPTTRMQECPECNHRHGPLPYVSRDGVRACSMDHFYAYNNYEDSVNYYFKKNKLLLFSLWAIQMYGNVCIGTHPSDQLVGSRSVSDWQTGKRHMVSYYGNQTVEKKVCFLLQFKSGSNSWANVGISGSKSCEYWVRQSVAMSIIRILKRHNFSICYKPESHWSGDEHCYDTFCDLKEDSPGSKARKVIYVTRSFPTVKYFVEGDASANYNTSKLDIQLYPQMAGMNLLIHHALSFTAGNKIVTQRAMVTDTSVCEVDPSFNLKIKGFLL